MKFKVLGLLGVLAALVALNYWDEWQTQHDKEEKELQTKLVTGHQSDVKRIEFESRAAEEGEPTTNAVIVRQGDEWHLEQPLPFKADQRSIENLLKTIYDYNFAKVVAEGSDVSLERFGLQKPLRRITLHRKATEPITILVGMKAPVGYDVYSMVDERVFIGSQYLLVSTAKSLFDLRHKGIVAANPSEVKNWTYFRRQAAGDLKLDFIRVGKEGFSQFKNADSQTTAANASMARDFLEDIGALKAAKFYDNPSDELLKKFGKPDIAVSWVEQDNRAVAILFVKEGDKYLAATDPSKVIFELPDNAAVKLEKSEMGFRNRRAFSFDSNQVTSVKIDGDAFVSINGQWFESSQEAKLKGLAEEELPEEEVHVRALLNDMEFAETLAFIDLQDPMVKELPDAPLHRITLSFANREPLLIDIYDAPKENDYRLVRYNRAQFVYKIDAAILQSMTATSHAELENEPDESAHDSFE